MIKSQEYSWLCNIRNSQMLDITLFKRTKEDMIRIVRINT